MFTVFNLHVLTSDHFISGTVRIPAITAVGPRLLLLHFCRDQLIMQQLCLCTGSYFTISTLVWIVFLGQNNIKIGKT